MKKKRPTNWLTAASLVFYFCCAIARNAQCAELSWLILLNG